MQIGARIGAGVTVLALGLGPLVGQAPAVGAAGVTAPAGGWVASRVRFEPLDRAATGLSADGGPGHRGALEVAPGGRLLVDLAVDDYVRGIQEVPASWPGAALQAQAVAARTYALRAAVAARARAGRSPADADLCATESCQVYTGLTGEQRPGGPAWVAATAATAGKVLLSRGAPILAMYSSSNGGRSVSGGQPYLPSVDDPDDAASPLYRWSQPLALPGLTAALGLPGPATGATRSGGTVIVTWERPVPLTVPPPPAAGSTSSAPPAAPARGESRFSVGDFRSRVNGGLPRGALPRTLPSDQFSLAPGAGAVVAEGRGFGHGIGMSQWGAYGKARRGLSADAILAAYYGGIRPQPAPAGAPTTLRVDLGAVADPVVRAVPTGAAPAPGAFRVVADGATLATVATGAWRVSAGPKAGTVRVAPPAEQAGGVALDQLAAGRTGPEPTAAIAVTFRLSAAAAVAVTGGPPQPLAAGDHRVEVPGGPEARTVVVAADAGGGRTASAAVEVAAVAPPAAAGPEPMLARAEPGVSPPTEAPADGLTEAPDAFGPIPLLTPASQASAGREPTTKIWLALPALLVVSAATWAARRGRRPATTPAGGRRRLRRGGRGRS